MKHKNDNLDDIGMVFGYLLMFFVFVTFLYFILNILGKLPESWGYFYIFLFGVFLIFVGKGIQYWLGGYRNG